MKHIIMYTQPDCPPCEYAKLFLKDKGYELELRDIQKDSKAKKELTTKYNSFSTPTFVIDEEVITGFDLEKLQKTLGFSN